MTRRALKALKKSIRKWQDILSGNGIDRAARNCGLCRVYLDRVCAGCPVYAHTKTPGCTKTPYDKWCRHHDRVHSEVFDLRRVEPGCRTCSNLASKELEFLKSLVPKE